jgi:hypothetical protein
MFPSATQLRLDAIFQLLDSLSQLLPIPPDPLEIWPYPVGSAGNPEYKWSGFRGRSRIPTFLEPLGNFAFRNIHVIIRMSAFTPTRVVFIGAVPFSRNLVINDWSFVGGPDRTV